MKCEVLNCNNEAKKRHYCNKHYLQFIRHGTIYQRTKYSPNEIKVNEKIAIIFLYNSKGEFVNETIIDSDDVEKVSKYKWHICIWKSAYVKNSKIGSLHDLIMNFKPTSKKVIDHKNHNTLDNRKENLRICTMSQNMSNSKIPTTNKSGIKGVYWAADRGKWRAEIWAKNKLYRLGSFALLTDAKKARLEGEKKYHGKFALNNGER